MENHFLSLLFLCFLGAALEKFMQDYPEHSGKEVDALKTYEEANRYRF